MRRFGGSFRQIASCVLLLSLSTPAVLAAGGGTRLILVAIDGFPGPLMEALLDPDSPSLEMLPEPDLFRSACADIRASLGRDYLVPNFDRYLRLEGCRVRRVASGTVTLSTPAWAVILTGYPSIIKANSYFNRSTGQVRFFLDAFRETMRTLVAKSGRTAPVWELDLLGIPLLEDYFDHDSAWTAIQLLYRQVPAEQLSSLGMEVVVGERGLLLDQLVSLGEGYDLPDRSDRAMVEIAAKKILERDPSGRERYDFVSLFFPSLDHQFHADADYRRIVEYIVTLDGWFGEIMNAVERSGRGPETVVAVLSDHGSDFSPTLLNRSFPINRWLRRKELGGHTVLSPYTERIATAASRPVRGIDAPRVYESEHSPYGPNVPFGEEGYFTAYTNHQGNSRFDAYLRNSDLNELHLILLRAMQASRSGKSVDALFPVFSAAAERVLGWSGTEEESALQVAEAFEAMAGRLADSSRRDAEDSVGRLREEAELYRRLAAALNQLCGLPRKVADWRRWVSTKLEISRVIPKGYLGPRNSFEQLRNYVVGWRSAESPDSGESLEFERIDYPVCLTRLEMTNPDSRGNRFPVDFVSIGLGPESVSGSRVPRDASQVIWMSASRGHGNALVIEKGNRIAYLPVGEAEGWDGRYHFESGGEVPDPLGYPSGVRGPLLTESQWAELTADHPYSAAPVVLANLFRDNYLPPLQDAGFNGLEPELGSAEAELLRSALRYRFSQGSPDFRGWISRGWNANPNLPTPTGTHGGFAPIVSRIVFSVWGGSATGVRRGGTVDADYLTWDIAPTLLDAVGKTLQQRGNRPGRIIPILEAGRSNSP